MMYVQCSHNITYYNRAYIYFQTVFLLTRINGSHSNETVRHLRIII